MIRSLAPNPDFQIGVKKRRSVSTLSIPRASDRGAEWVDCWQVNLTLILESYIKSLGIQTAVDCTAENLYRNQVDWNFFSNEYRVYHIFGEQNAGPALSEAIGNFLGNVAWNMDDYELSAILSDKNGYKTRYERIFFLSELADVRRIGLPEEEPYEFQRNENIIVPRHELPEDLLSLKDFKKSDTVFT